VVGELDAPAPAQYSFSLRPLTGSCMLLDNQEILAISMPRRLAQHDRDADGRASRYSSALRKIERGLAVDQPALEPVRPPAVVPAAPSTRPRQSCSGPRSNDFPEGVPSGSTLSVPANIHPEGVPLGSTLSVPANIQGVPRGVKVSVILG